LKASEWLVAQDLSAFDEVLAASEGGPTIVLTPVGPGRVLVVGAMDAWRQRGTDEEYERFWRAAVARLAEATGPPVAVSVEPTWARPGQDVDVRLSARSVGVLTSWLATATLTCNGTAPIPLRLWPADAAGEFRGSARLDGSTGSCAVTARVAGLGEGTAHVQVAPNAAVPPSARESLDRTIERTGGLALGHADLPQLIEALHAGRSTDRVPETRHPMRSSWWMLPFAFCLAGEWWLRRRSGRR
jgi:hypothetical protein